MGVFQTIRLRVFRQIDHLDVDAAAQALKRFVTAGTASVIGVKEERHTALGSDRIHNQAFLFL